MVRWGRGERSQWGTQGARASLWPADHSPLDCVTLTSEKGLILEEWSAAGPVSKTEWDLDPLVQ